MTTDSRSQTRAEQRPPSQPAQQFSLPLPTLMILEPCPTYIISDEHDSPLDKRLNHLAFALFEFDFKLLEKVHNSFKKTPTQNNSTEAATAPTRVEDFKKVLEQRNEIKNGTSGFARRYLTDNAFVQFWNLAFQLHKKTLSSNRANSQGNNIQSQFERRLSGYVSLAVALEKAVLYTVGEGLLSEEIEVSIAARWRNLDRFLEWYLRNRTVTSEDEPNPSHNVMSWQAMSIRIREIKKKRTVSQKQHSHTHLSNPSENIISPIILSSLILAFGACLSTGIFAVGYSKSPHKKGSIQDADFWFSTQASIAQMTCLISSTLVTWKSSRALTWHWLLPAGIASFCTFSTAPLYIFAPTEWASFSAFVATMLQSVLVLYPIFFTPSENQEEQDKKFK